MKKLVTFVGFLFFVTVASAANINISSKKDKFKQFAELLQEQVNWAEDVLDEFLEPVLGCSDVNFHLTILKKPGFFKPVGEYILQLTATCTESFSDFKFNFHDGYDQDYTILGISFVKKGKLIKKNFWTSSF